MKHDVAANVEGDGTTAELCQWITDLKASQVPPEILERAKYLILDGIGCGLVGAHVPWSEQLADALALYEPVGTCAVIGHEARFGPIAAATLNGGFIQATELDDYHSVAPLHSASVILPALLAVVDMPSSSARNKTHLWNGSRPSSSATKTTGAQFLLAALVGFETGPRVGTGMHGTQMLSRGWHSGPIFGAPAAAAAVSKLLDLGADDTESALGIACTQAGGLMSAQYEGMIKRVQHAFAARNGLFGALLARTGYVGIKKVLERPYGGFLAQFTQGCGRDPQFLIHEVARGLGQTWFMEDIRVKLHACVGGCHGQVELLERMQRAHPARFAAPALAQIRAIRVGLSEPIYAHDGWPPEPRPMNATGAQMNAAFIGAVQLVDRQVLLSQFADSALDRDEVWDLAYKTTCYHDASFDRPNCQCGARIAVEFDDGEVIEDSLEKPKGFDPPITNADILAKWRKVAPTVIDQDRLKDIERMVLGLEDLEDVAELTRQLGKTCGNALAGTA